MSATADAARDRRLLFAGELADGTVDPAALERPEVVRATRRRRTPPPARIAQRLLMKRGRLSYERATAAPRHAARRAVLGAAADAPPRLLVRVDEFPHYEAWDHPDRYGTDAYRRFHDVMASAGMPYLVAVPPRVSRDPLNPAEARWRPLDDGEVQQLASLRRDGTVAFALHGLDHRTRDARPRRHSELAGLSAGALEERLALADAELAAAGIETAVFVPPFNRFDARQYPVLARRYAVVCGGPESVPQLGYQDTPSWRDGAVWLPSYPPLYGTAAQVRPAVRRLVERQTGLWTPVVLHWGWEADAGFDDLIRFAREAARWTAPWSDFLAAVDASR